MALTLFAVDFDEVEKHRHNWLNSASGSPVYVGDRSPEAKHLIWIYGDEVAGIASIVPDMKKVGADNINWRLRAMTIAPAHRGNGRGEEFLHSVINFAKKKNVYPFYGSCKEGATGMYKGLGAIVCPKTYEINDQGLHVDFIFAN